MSLVCFAIVCARAALSSRPEAPRALDANERRAVARELAHHEVGWRARAAAHFPGDHWSQDDDFHNLEQVAARRIAQERRVALSSVFLAIDEELRTSPGRRDGASPCKPRPFYD